MKNNYSVLLVCENTVSANNLQSLLEEAGIRTAFVQNYDHVDEVPRRIPIVTCGAIPSFELMHSAFVCISELAGNSMRIVKREKKRTSSVAQSSKQKLLSYADLTVGDLVVHDAHGIGRYVGIENIKTKPCTLQNKLIFFKPCLTRGEKPFNIFYHFIAFTCDFFHTETPRLNTIRLKTDRLFIYISLRKSLFLLRYKL